MLAPREKLWPAHPLLVEAALDMLAVSGPECLVADFGCGDGPALFGAAARGCRAIGWEVHQARAAALAAEVQARGLGGSITVIAGNALEADFDAPGASVPSHVYLYLIARGLRLMLPTLRLLAARQPSGTLPVVTALYSIEGLTPVEVRRVTTGEGVRTPLYLYSVAAAEAAGSSSTQGEAEGVEKV